MKGLKNIRESCLSKCMAEADKYRTSTLAEMLGVSVPTYYKMEADPGSIKVADAQRLADYFGVPVEDLFLD